MRRGADWLLIVLAAILLVGLMAYARGAEHHRGDEIGSQGATVVMVRAVP
jgi:hypothetical protein